MIGVLAGCPIAMGLLLLNVINPIDSFWAKLPKQISTLWVYVDDIIMLFTFDKAEHTYDLITMRVAHAYRRLNDSLKRDGASCAVGKSNVVSNDRHASDRIAKELNRCEEN